MSNLLLSNTLYFDGSLTNPYTKSGAGCVIMDNNGNLVVAASYNLSKIGPQNVAIVEAIALFNGLKLAQRLGIKVDQVKGDNKEVIDHVRGQSSRGPKPGPLSEIIVEIKGILGVLKIDPILKLEHISREDNEVADSLAKKGSRLWCESKVYNSEDELPDKTAQLVRQKKSLNGGGGGGGGGGLRNFNTALHYCASPQPDRTSLSPTLIRTSKVFLPIMSYSNSNNSNNSNYIVECNCEMSALIKRSSTRTNSGRRFWSCPNYDHATGIRGCGFFRWYDLDCTTWQRDLYNALLDEKEALNNELFTTTTENARLRCEIQKLQVGVKMKNYVVFTIFFIVIMYLGRD